MRVELSALLYSSLAFLFVTQRGAKKGVWEEKKKKEEDKKGVTHTHTHFLRAVIKWFVPPVGCRFVRLACCTHSRAGMLTFITITLDF